MHRLLKTATTLLCVARSEAFCCGPSFTVGCATRRQCPTSAPDRSFLRPTAVAPLTAVADASGNDDEAAVDVFLLLVTGGLEHVAARRVAEQLFGSSATRPDGDEPPAACGEDDGPLAGDAMTMSTTTTRTVMVRGATIRASDVLGAPLSPGGEGVVAIARPPQRTGVCDGKAGVGKLLLFVRRDDDDDTRGGGGGGARRLRAVAALDGVSAPLAFVAFAEGVADDATGPEQVCSSGTRELRGSGVQEETRKRRLRRCGALRRQTPTLAP